MMKILSIVREERADELLFRRVYVKLTEINREACLDNPRTEHIPSSNACYERGYIVIIFRVLALYTPSHKRCSGYIYSAC